MVTNLTQRWRRAKPLVRAELIATAWEIFSVLLFVSAVVPAAFTTAWPVLLFAGGLVLSSLVAGPLARRGKLGMRAAALLRVLLWLLAAIPMLSGAPLRLLAATLGFGLMAGGIRRAAYRRMLPPDHEEPSAAQLRANLRSLLGENAMVAGIVGGHVLLLFSVAFLRTASSVVFRAWWEIIPVLAILGTLGFTLAIRPATRRVLAALDAGPEGSREQLAEALEDARKIPHRLYQANFATWLICISIGVFYFQPGPSQWLWGDAIMQVGLGGLFAWGVSFYQRGWHEDAVADAVAFLQRWTRAASAQQHLSLRSRMLREFGLPLLFTTTLSFFAAISLYRTLAPHLPWQEDFAAISALGASFLMMVLAAGGLFLRASRQLSDPLSTLAGAADRAASGQLDRPIPKVTGPVEVVGLGQSIEHMRRALAQTIDELRQERASLETNVELRTSELKEALDELQQAQTALVQGERMALIGELVASVAHEIYNPLNAIGGSIGSLERVAGELEQMLASYRELERDLPAEQREKLAERRAQLDVDGALSDLAGVVKVVQSATRRSTEIVSNLKSFARAPAEPIPTDLHQGLGETLSLLRHRLKRSGIELSERYDALPEVTCRAGEINQVFMNLLTNAIQAVENRHGRRGGGRIEVRTSREDDNVCIAIADNGGGVPEAIRHKIFDPYFTTKGREGTGLGLAISRDIVRRHGGSIAATDDGLDGGACLTCRLPIEPTRRVASRPGVGKRGLLSHISTNEPG